MMKKKKFKLLWPTSNCCLKKFFDLESISKYGSIVVILIMLAYQTFNIFIGMNFNISIFSIIINSFFLVIILTKLEIIKIDFLEKYLNKILKLIILIFILNFLAYLSSDSQIHNYVFAPISFLGAYFIWLLLVHK